MNSKEKDSFFKILAEKQACESRAVRTIGNLLQPSISPEALEEAAGCFEPRHYEDLVEERSIIRLCGWPCCPQYLDNVPRARYHISTKEKKVYDITERKKFCSAKCYKLSKQFHAGLSSTPVWRRDQPSESDQSNHLHHDRPSETDHSNQLHHDQSSETDHSNHLHRDQSSEIDQNDHMTNLLRKSLDELPLANDKQTKTKGSISSETVTSLLGKLEIVERGIGGEDGRGLKMVHTVQVSDDDSDDYSDGESLVVEGSGSTRDLDIRSDRGKHEEDCSSSNARFVDLVGKDKFLGIFRSWFTTNTLRWSKDRNTVTYSVEDIDSELESEGEETISGSGDATVLPLVHSIAPIQIQRNIFMQQLKVNIVAVEKHLDADLCQITEDLVALGSTFRLSKDNIVFNPFEWRIIICLLISSFRLLPTTRADMPKYWLYKCNITQEEYDQLNVSLQQETSP